MKIQIKHINNTFNYGSFMMAITLINKLKQKFNNLEIYIDAESDSDLKRIIEETGFNNIFRDNVGVGTNILQRCRNKIKRVMINKSIRYVDNIIIIGGDDISEYYGVQALENELKKLQKISENKNIILLGQTIGPFTEERGEIARKSLMNTKIYTRDDNSFKYLQGLGFKNINKGRDLAFLPLPKQGIRKDILNKYNLLNQEYITIVPSGLVKCYTENRERYILEQIKILNNILEKDELKNKKLVLLPHVLLPENVDDRLIITEIVNKIEKKYRNRIVEIQDAILPSEAREILGNGMFTITGRMHAAVSTLFMGKPAISLSYSVKYSGVIGDGLNLDDLIIECSDKEMWNRSKVNVKVTEKINYILENYDKLTKKINQNVEKSKKITDRALENLIFDIKNIERA